MSSLLALASAATFGVADFLGGFSTRKASVGAVTLLTNLAGGAVALVLLFIVGGTWTMETVLWSAAGGLCGLVGLLLLYSGLAEGPNRLVSPLSAVVAAVVPVAMGVGLGERPDRIALIGLAITPLAVWLLAGGEFSFDSEDRRPIMLGLVAGLGFGFFFALIAQVPDGSGAVPLLVARTASISVLLVAAIVTKPSFPTPKWGGLSLVAGSLDMTANGLFLWSSREGDLAVVGALVNLFPATTVLLAVVVLRERLTRSQLVGVSLAIGAAVLLS